MLLLGGVILLGTAWLRGAEYDESYTIFLSLGTPRPDWPIGDFTISQAWAQLAGYSSLPGIAEDLRRTDVHPPLYFWTVAAWRAAIGTSLFATRAFSVLCALGALAVVGKIARRTGIPAISAMLLTLGCYGFVYTGAIARGFALAMLLNLAGVALLLGRRHLLSAGLLLGAAGLANYLAVFTAAAALFGTLLTGRRADFFRAALGFAATLPVILWFFLPQRAARTGQFPPFEIIPALSRLAQYAAANIFGGLPLYAGSAAPFVTVLLAVLLIVLLALVGRQVNAHFLLALCVAAPPLGLLALGIVFNSTPIELRYLAFFTPFFALLLAAALAHRPCLLAGILAIQSVALAGLAIRPETMQPQSAAAAAAMRIAGPNGLILLPRGNDGVGVVGSFLLGAPAERRINLVTPTTDIAGLRATASKYPIVVVALLALDAQSRATVDLLRDGFAEQECWRERPAAANLRAYENTCRG